MTPNPQVPATAEGMPKSRLRAVLIGAARTSAPHGFAALGANESVIPSWMELKIEVHRAALADLERQSRTLETLSMSTSVSNVQRPSAWIADAERAYTAAMDRETRAISALLAERSRTPVDARARDRYLASLRGRRPTTGTSNVSCTTNGGF